MAILAPPDWQYSPREPAMDKGPSQSQPPASSSSSSTPSPQPQPQRPSHPQQQQPAQYGAFQQQPQGSWTPSLAAAPFYPGAFYHQPGQGTPPVYPANNPYFDPANANAQLAAQWAYQQMMFNAAAAQQHQQHEYFQPPQMAFNPFPSGTPPPRPGPNDMQQQSGGYHPYRRPSRQQSSSQSDSPQTSSTNEWRPQPPYSKPEASGSSSSVNSQGRVRTNSNNSNKATSPTTTTSNNSRSSPIPSNRPSPATSSSSQSNNGIPAPPRIPHHRAGSSSSTHSAHSTSSSSGISSPPSVSAAKLARPSPLSQGAIIAPSRTSTSSSLGPASTTRAERRISRDDSSLALSSLSLLATRAEAAKSASAGSSSQTATTPSSTLTSATPPAPAVVKGSGLKGRLRRALSFNSSVALKEELDDEYGEEDEEEGGGNASDDSDASIKASVVNPKQPSLAKTPAVIQNATRKAVPPASTSGSAFSATSVASSSTASTLPVGQQVPLPKKKSRAASLFSNARLNASTDNISLSSTVSSASVMIRKLGSMGRLARRNSLAGITGLFKDRKKKDNEGGEDDNEEGSGKKDKDKKKKDKKASSGKGSASEASVSHATAELEAGDWSVPTNDSTLKGLSPAAKLARQHTLKSNAEAAAKAKEAAARAAQAQAQSNGNGVNGGGVPTWERNTATRRGGGGMQVAEDGTRVFVEDSGSEGEDEPQHYPNQPQQQWAIDEEDDEDEEWGMIPGEEDDTIRQEIADAHRHEEGGDEYGYGEEEVEPWAVDLRRSVERTRVPTKGILKNADTYNQAAYLPENIHHFGGSGPLPALRARSNSYNAPGQTELGPLARIPSPDPDHIDGLHRHGSHSSGHGHGTEETSLAAKRSSVPSLPPLGFDLDLGGSMFESPQVTPTAATYAQAAAASSQPPPTPPSPQAPQPAPASLYQHPALNSSAPALTTLNFGLSASSSVPRAATAPAKKHLAFASNLSVYDTFSASTYDRRSEPATWSRLTPQLAQRIKEELNSYKMEEMEVHAASRVHTQFFV
ncbi:hypothetical protein MIND_00414800 [Mycena indigotica]|uniref:Uncharacterized protein n=1 Tax=Mycena indigotica TaxID=2126181 RepID=A0A8H6W623_9AGAR|nr:uncharacterized protein MIND_00414800 [Mycena indigotica]KAF7306242.1 hypothetical protein MIND_00414800 [Mycena indigotica]